MTLHMTSPNWPRLYTAVLAVLAIEIALFYAFTRSFQ